MVGEIDTEKYKLREFRFDPDGECRQICIDQVLDFFNIKFFPKELVLEATNTVETIKLLQNAGFRTSIYLPLISIVSPFQLPLIFNAGRFTFSRRTFKSWLDLRKKQAILFHLTAYQLYRVRESWTHCVTFCYHEDSDEGDLFDPYLNLLFEHYPHASVRDWSLDDLLSLTSVILLIEQ